MKPINFLIKKQSKTSVLIFTTLTHSITSISVLSTFLAFHFNAPDVQLPFKMFSSRTHAIVSFIFKVGLIVGSNCQCYDKIRQQFTFVHSKSFRVKVNFIMVLLYGCLKASLVIKNRKVGNLDAYYLSIASIYGDLTLILIYGLPAYYSKDTTQSFNAVLSHFQYLSRMHSNLKHGIATHTYFCM